MAEFNFEGYMNFKTDYTVRNGEVIDENNLNLAPLRLKKEINNIYNIQRINNGHDPLPWSNAETYLPGEIVLDDDGKWYRAKMYTFNNKPSDSPKQWEHITYFDISVYGTLENYLAKDNTTPYTPTDDYNPATKKYIDNAVYKDGNPDNGYNYLAKDNVIPYTPTGDYNPATKKYVDDSIQVITNNNNTFNNLIDTPNSYSGNAGKVAAVKPDESGLEFINISSGSDTFINLTDTPNNYSGKTGQFVVVNSSEDGVVFTNVIDGGLY